MQIDKIEQILQIFLMDNFYEGLSEQAESSIAMLNHEQKVFFELVSKSVENAFEGKAV